MQAMQQAPPEAAKFKDVFTIVERGEKKAYWVKLGTAFTNRDGSLNVYLDAVPTNGRLQIREHVPWEERRRNDDIGPLRGQNGGL